MPWSTMSDIRRGSRSEPSDCAKASTSPIATAPRKGASRRSSFSTSRRLWQPSVLAQRREHAIDRHGVDAQVVGAGRRLGAEEGVGDRRLGGLRRGLEQRRYAIVVWTHTVGGSLVAL